MKKPLFNIFFLLLLCCDLQCIASEEQLVATIRSFKGDNETFDQVYNLVLTSDLTPTAETIKDAFQPLKELGVRHYVKGLLFYSCCPTWYTKNIQTLAEDFTILENDFLLTAQSACFDRAQRTATIKKTLVDNQMPDVLISLVLGYKP